MDFGPISPIIAALLGAAIAALSTYFMLFKRRVIMFWISDSEDLTLPLRKSNPFVTFKVGENEFSCLNRAKIVVKNSGNEVINNFFFDIEIPEKHGYVSFETSTKDVKLQQSIHVTAAPENHVVMGGKFFVTSDYLNKKDKFTLFVFFDGKTRNCQVRCRLENTKVIIKRGDEVPRRIPGWLPLLCFIIGMLCAVAFHSVIVQLRFIQSLRIF